MAIFRGIGGAGDSTTDATVTAVTEQAVNAANSASAAASSAGAASSSAAAAAASASTANTANTYASANAVASNTSATNAANSAAAAADSETAAAASETAAAASETAAAGSSSTAAAWALNAANSASTATTQATNAATSASTATTQATNAASSATSAASSASTATTKASEAASSASGAATSATNAATSETNAATSASNAGTSETNAASSASAASTSATNAANSASAASTSATNAGTSETNAASSATNAATSETNASNSASAASTSATNAATSETNASNSASAAATSATNADTSATNAATSATNAATSETNAATSATSAATSATNAATSETNAASSATSAATSATNASTSATNAATSETNAATSASAAATSESNAATSATNAANSATSAATSATNAQTAADAALTALDSFDDRYLGQKTSDPTLDNDGNALVSGALYFNTTDGVMKVYDGTNWLAAYASLSGALLVANNLSDLNNAASARTNLGLVASATTDTTDAGNISSGTLSADRLATSGVTADSYGSSTAIPTITVDSKGRITAASTSAYSTASTSTAGVIKIEDDIVQTTAANAVTSTSGRTYGVQVNSSGQAVVNVPWVDTNTDTNNYVTSASFNTSTGVLSLARAGLTDVTVDLDGKYADTSSSATAVDDLNTYTTNGVFGVFCASNHPSGSKTAGQLIVSASGTYINQTYIVQDEAYVRRSTNSGSTWSAWSEIWTSTTDGSGSGLDADLLDGQHGSYYAPASSLGNYVLKSGDTMSGQLVIGDGSAAPLELTRTSQVGIEFNDTSVGSRYLGVNGGNLLFGVNLNHGVNDKVFHDGYHPNADKWTTARTLSLTGDVTGSVSWDGSTNVSMTTVVGDNSHNHNIATSTTPGFVEVFSDIDQTVAANAVTATAGRTYGIQLNSANQAVVNVPWTDNNTTYTGSKGITLTGTDFRITGNEIPGSVDLNTYRTTGFYTQNANADAASGSNYPITQAGILQVINDDYGNGLHTTQLYSQYNSINYYHRTYYNGTWTSWRNLAQDTNTTYSAASTTNLGLIKLEDDTVQTTAANAVTSTASRTYGVQVNSSGQAVVNVPWSDTNTTYGIATDTTAGLVELFSNTDQSVAANAVTTVAGRTYGIQLNSANQMVVNVPWEALPSQTGNAGKLLTTNGTTVSWTSTIDGGTF